MLDRLRNDNSIKDFTNSELNALCDEIRIFLVEHVSKTGGHLAANLGVVELTIAIHKVFDLPNDKLILDVGHQSYVHKILSGRIDSFDTLRTFGGISGFPKRSESEYDCFNTGHSSTSVSAALGMARARDLLGESYNIIALFGDGALTGGEIYEALNDAGQNKTPLILILNDNHMSISKNVGAMAKHLRNIRINKHYFRSKLKISRLLDRIPLVGLPSRQMIESVKRRIRKSVLPTTMFDELGYKYIGPVDGHNLNSLISCLTYARMEKRPVIIHVCTHKGKGYAPAEKHADTFHGVGGFNAKTGEIPEHGESYSSRFGKKLVQLAEENKKITAITCAMPNGTGLVEFSKQYRNRFFDVGIAEQHGVTLAAGMAVQGLIPVIPLYSTFMQRAFDQILHDVCLQNLHVVFPIDRAGVVGADGETHQGVYDISFLSCMPNMTLLSPSDFAELDEMLDYAVNRHSGPIAIRYPRGGAESGFTHERFELNKVYIKEDGTDAAIITTGRMLRTAKAVFDKLKSERISVQIKELPTIRPINEAEIISSAMKCGLIITIEDNVLSGGFGERVCSVLATNGLNTKVKTFGLPDEPIVHGSVAELDKHYGLDADSIAEYIIRKIKNGKDKT
ncbi:MAG: 1-deoxy-D-xylulose-5-phosphate synthase [Clostridia bacterium]|nr:1-deoxy-D-xylulose-5-phosphate synthase [Clostridia bacterium]